MCNGDPLRPAGLAPSAPYYIACRLYRSVYISMCTFRLVLCRWCQRNDLTFHVSRFCPEIDCASNHLDIDTQVEHKLVDHIVTYSLQPVRFFVILVRIQNFGKTFGEWHVLSPT